jgi:hypothetical protein
MFTTPTASTHATASALASVSRPRGPRAVERRSKRPPQHRRGLGSQRNAVHPRQRPFGGSDGRYRHRRHRGARDRTLSAQHSTNPANYPVERRAVELYRLLSSRGIRLYLVGDRLRVEPWSALSDDERAAVRAMRSEIKRLVRAPVTPTLSPKTRRAGVWGRQALNSGPR